MNNDNFKKTIRFSDEMQTAIQNILIQYMIKLFYPKSGFNTNHSFKILSQEYNPLLVYDTYSYDNTRGMLVILDTDINIKDFFIYTDFIALAIVNYKQTEFNLLNKTDKIIFDSIFNYNIYVRSQIENYTTRNQWPSIYFLLLKGLVFLTLSNILYLFKTIELTFAKLIILITSIFAPKISEKLFNHYKQYSNRAIRIRDAERLKKNDDDRSQEQK